MRVWQFFWDLVLLGIIVLIATRVTAVMDRDRRFSPAARWAILIGLILAGALFLSVSRWAGPLAD
ncbi:MAG: hypothetical protein GTO46_00585 [Gemmatimonadetes bacterium]|nr:hypothetical protein [Gemmatimonadota bacterium]NIO30276.1 hypothetical protein [Gemmatimonadota bacterium]UCC81524.1 MAG: hypothetical protein JSW46_10940 [Gemmatimonadota bacterium]